MDRNNIFDLFKIRAYKTFDELVAMTVDRNGYMREKAVLRLGELGNPAAMPYLIERANDWVPQIRKAAYDSILSLRKPENALAFINALPDLLRLETRMRGAHGTLIVAVQDFLCAKTNRALLVESMSATDPRVARMVCRLVIQRKLLGTTEMLRRCLSSTDVLVRSLASDSLRTLDVESFDAVVDQALSDRFMPVRREAFQQLLARDHVRGLATARTFLFDRNVSVREIAVANLLRDGFDVPAFYDCALSNVKGVRSLACIVWAWAELKRTERIEDLKRLTEYSSTTIRRTALQALAKLMGKDVEPYLVKALSDEARSVCTASSRLIVSLEIDLTADRLTAVARTNRTPQTITACCNIASVGNKWEWLRFVLGLCGDTIAVEEQESLDLQLKEWNLAFNKSATQPTAQQIAAIVPVARLCVAKMDQKLFQEVAFSLKVYGGIV